jgi:hypothetical protein
MFMSAASSSTRRKPFTVRQIFERYLELGSVRFLKNDLDQRGTVSKIKVSRKGIRSGGRCFSRGALYEPLANPIYVGEIRHKQERHPGQHEAIVNRGLWEKVQQHLHDHAARHRERPTKALPSPLAGRLFDENGEPLYAQGATKGGRRYRYYVSRDLVRGLAEQRQGGWRVPAPEIERAVIGAARGILDDKPVILAAIQTSAIDAPDMNHIFAITDRLERTFADRDGNGGSRRRSDRESAIDGGRHPGSPQNTDPERSDDQRNDCHDTTCLPFRPDESEAAWGRDANHPQLQGRTSA